MLEKKANALINFLREQESDNTITIDGTIESIDQYRENEYTTIYGVFLVLTEEEAEQEASEDIKNSFWAFNPDFILKHTEFYNNSTPTEDEAFIDALQILQGKLCESANPIIKALIIDTEAFIEDAIIADGRAHFLSFYDGKEHEQDGFFIYRTN